MRIAASYSHLNGKEVLLDRKPELWKEIRRGVESVDARTFRTMDSRGGADERTGVYSANDMGTDLERSFAASGWEPVRIDYWVTDSEDVSKSIQGLDSASQELEIKASGRVPIGACDQMDLVKRRVALQVQFGDFRLVANDLFVKHPAFRRSDVIDLGIEVLPMKSLESQMNGGVSFYEQALANLIRAGQGTAAVPLVLIGVEP